MMIVSLRHYDSGANQVENSVENVEKSCWKCWKLYPEISLRHFDSVRMHAFTWFFVFILFLSRLFDMLSLLYYDILIAVLRNSFFIATFW